ncbi:glycosyltransferase family 39 protein [Lentisphaerota bacterium WC36G]|nr:glycosyltransferase family 39 protein [Lentisphaerae bacterium WC36]
MFKKLTNQLFMNGGQKSISVSGYKSFLKKSFYSVLILSIAFRVLYCLFCAYIEDDTGLYLNIARAFYLDQSLPKFDLNFYPLLISYGMHCGFDPITVAYFLSLLSSIILLFVTYGIGKLIFKRRFYAIIALGVVGSHPKLIALGSRLIRDGHYLMLFAVTVYFLLKAYKNKNCFYWFLSGGFTALASAFRKEGAELIVFIVLSLLFILFSSKENIKIQMLLFVRNMFIALTGFMLTFAFINYLIYDELRLENNIVVHCLQKLKNVKKWD